MRLVVLAFLLIGCTSVPLAELVEPTTNMLASAATGNYSGAAMQGLDVVMMLLGLKGLDKAGKFAKKKLVNPEEVVA